MRTAAILLCFAVALPAAIGAQHLPDFAPLAIPEHTPVRCEADTADKFAALSLRFEIGDELEPNWRQITVDYDSSGGTVAIREMLARKTPGTGVTTDMLVAVFTPKRSFGLINHQGNPVTSADSSGRRRLTDAEMRKAQALGAWLWKRRCKPL